MKNTLQEINSRLSHTEEHISDLEDRIMKVIQKEKKKHEKYENSLGNFWDNICIIGVSEKESERD